MDSLEQYIRTKGICHTASAGGRLAALNGTGLRVVVDLQPEEDLLKRLDAAFAEARKNPPTEDEMDEARKLLGE